MTNTATQIVSAYERLNLSLEDIASEQDISVTEVKLVLSQFSSVFRAAVKEDRDDSFTDDESLLVRDGMIRLLNETEDENLRFRILKYVRDDKKGRKDAIVGLNKVNINIALFNEQLKRMQLVAGVTRSITAISQPRPPPNITSNESETIEV